MTRQEQQDFYEEFIKTQRIVMLSKGDDYAGQDRLSNFKRAGAICGISAEQQCLSLVAVKVARLGELLSGKEPNNESTRDSIMDLSLYSILLAMILSEKG